MPGPPPEPATQTRSTIDGCSHAHSAPAFFPDDLQNPPGAPSCACRHISGPRCAFPPTPTSSACRCGNALPSPNAVPGRARPRGSSRSRATLVRSSRFLRLPWLVPLLKRLAAEPATLPASGQQIPQHQPRPQQACLHRRDGNAQRLGGLLNIQLLHVAHDEDFAILAVKRCQRIGQPLPNFLALQRFGGNLAPVGKV